MQYVKEVPVSQLRIKVWSGTNKWTLYEDDGESFEYENGDWSTTTYQVYAENEKTIVEVNARVGSWQPQPRTVIVEVVGVGEQQFEDDGTARRLVF
jgi:alpha-glucosidase